MKFLLPVVVGLSFCCAEEASDWSNLLPDASGGLTLDDEALEAVRTEMRGEPPVSADVALWRKSMNAESTEARDATLICLLLRLNPGLAHEAALPELISLLQLHSRAVAGHPEACAELAQALRLGMWRQLCMPCDPESADKLTARTAF